jgi:hypothetical protein
VDLFSCQSGDSGKKRPDEDERNRGNHSREQGITPTLMVPVNSGK